MKGLFSFQLLIVLVFAAWLCGFLSFVADIETMSAPGVKAGMENADAIVVLTGGSERVTTGLELLEAGNGKKLFISGVHKKLTLDGVLGPQPVNATLRECCIALGYQAGSTIGNAEETRAWMQQQDYHSLILVTANYHMPRSLLLFHSAMPAVDIIPHAIAPGTVILTGWWQHPGTIDLLATEFTKYILTDFQLWVSKQ